MSSVTDMTKGVYRRVYAGFILGRRINAISIGAEAWFWRMHAVADDFGNLSADPVDVRALTQGRRDVTLDQIAGWIAECVAVGLMQQYEAKGQQFLHIDGFELMQLPPRNGKRLQKVPRHPSEVHLGSNGCKSVKEGAKGASHSHSHSHHQHQEGAAAPRGGGEGAGGGEGHQNGRQPAQAAAAAEPTESQRRLARTLQQEPWSLRQRKANEIAATYPEPVIAAAKRLATGRGIKNPGGCLIAKLESGEAAEEAAGRRGHEIPPEQRHALAKAFREAEPTARMWADEQVLQSRMFAEWLAKQATGGAA